MVAPSLAMNCWRPKLSRTFCSKSSTNLLFAERSLSLDDFRYLEKITVGGGGVGHCIFMRQRRSVDVWPPCVRRVCAYLGHRRHIVCVQFAQAIDITKDGIQIF